jgi:hypothetical protein
MTPLLFAAVVVLSPMGAQPSQTLDPAPAKPPLLRDLPAAPPGVSAQTYVLKSLPAACASQTTKTVGPDGARLWKLTELPPALQEHAVWRTVNGCPVREIVYAGQTYYIEGGEPQIEERLEGKRIAHR